MNFPSFQLGEQVRVITYGPFCGLRGTIQVVDSIDRPDEVHCFYLVTLEGSYMREPVWFGHDEVETASSVVLPS